jgi:hypothetical protein
MAEMRIGSRERPELSNRSKEWMPTVYFAGLQPGSLAAHSYCSVLKKSLPDM